MRQGSYLTLTLLLLIFGSAAVEAGPDYQLEIRDASNQLITHFPLQHGHWCLHWRHSVTGIAVEDCYRTEAGQMQLSHSWQPDFAAGLGHFEGRGTLVSHPQGGYLIESINEPVPGNGLWIRVGSESVAHTLISADTHLNLSQLAAGQRLRLQLISTQH